MPDRFDLEQQIQQTWRITEDLHDLIEAFDNMSYDERYNYLIGLRAIYETKFEKLWSIFEELIHTGQLGSKTKLKRSLDEVYDEVDDILEWSDNKDGSLTLRKKDNVGTD